MEVTLKNGSVESKSLVVVAMISLKSLMEDELAGLLALYELHALCKDSSHRIFSDAQFEKLMELGLIQSDKTVHSSIRNIVLSSVSIDGFNITIDDPIRY